MDATQMKTLTARLFDSVAQAYDQSGVQYFRPAGRRLVAHAELKPGESILDVGCGRGAVLFPAAEAVGPTGRVVGIDISPEMVRLTAGQAGPTAPVTVQVMDAEKPDLPPADFDAVLGSFSIVLFPGAPAALPRYRRLLRPGGRLGFTAPLVHEMGLPMSFPPELVPLFSEIAERFRALPGPPLLLDPPRLWYSTPEAIDRTVGAAGFGRVMIEEEPLTVTAPSGAAWVRWSWAQAQRVSWLRLDDAERHDLMDRITAAFDSLRGPDGSITYSVPVRYVLAR